MFGIQVVLVVGIVGAIDILRNDAVTGMQANTSPLLDAGLNAFILGAGGAAFCCLVGMS